MSDDTKVLVCATVTSLPPGLEDPGSVVRWCGLCADEVWVSLDGQRFIDHDHSVRVCCTDCAEGELATVEDYRIEAVPGSERFPFQRPMMREFRRRIERKRRG